MRDAVTPMLVALTCELPPVQSPPALTCAFHSTTCAASGLTASAFAYSNFGSVCAVASADQSNAALASGSERIKDGFTGAVYGPPCMSQSN